MVDVQTNVKYNSDWLWRVDEQVESIAADIAANSMVLGRRVE